MRRSARSSVVTWLTATAPCSRKLSEFGVCPLAAVKLTASLFCAIRLAMPFARLSDRLDAKNAQIVSKVIARRRRNKNAPVEMVAAVHPVECVNQRPSPTRSGLFHRVNPVELFDQHGFVKLRKLF